MTMFYIISFWLAVSAITFKQIILKHGDLKHLLLEQACALARQYFWSLLGSFMRLHSAARKEGGFAALGWVLQDDLG